SKSCLAGAVSLARASQKNACCVQHPPTTHRIQRFITFFSSNDHQNKHSSSSLAAASSRTSTKQHLKRSTTTLNSSHVAPVFVPVNAKDVRKQGQLVHQETALGESSKYDRRRWEQCWAVLHAYNLYLCRQLSSYVSDETQEKVLNIPADSRTIDVRSAIVDIAYELLQRKDEQRAHVFRVVTQRRTEHLLQAESESEMLKWIDNIRSASTATAVVPADDRCAATHRAKAAKANSADSVLNIPADSRTIDVRSAIVDIAYELLQRKDEQRAHVFRVVTQRRTEHLLQAESESEMLKWIDNIRSASTATAVVPADDRCAATHRAKAAKANSADSETALGESSKYDRRRWEQCWAVLHAYNLYLCRQLSSYVSDETQEKVLNIPADSRTIDVRSAIVDIAYELLQRKDEQRAHVFRVVTQRRTEHLLQAESESEMLKWIDNIRSASTATAVVPADDRCAATHRAKAAKANSADSHGREHCSVEQRFE
ncbi:GTPase-activating protein pac-1, partial [Toxocara canis]